MKKIGEYWIPDDDAQQGYNLERARYAFEGREGVQIGNLYDALQRIDRFNVAIDGGANVGSWTRIMARKFATVFAFEPYNPAFECLRQNVRDWGITEKVTIYEAALSEDEEMVSVAPAGKGRRSVTCSVIGPGSTPAMTIDSLNLHDCSLIKLDIEGYEARALRGARETIAIHKPWVLIENKQKQGFLKNKPTEAERLLKRWGYAPVEKFGEREIDWLFGIPGK